MMNGYQMTVIYWFDRDTGCLFAKREEQCDPWTMRNMSYIQSNDVAILNRLAKTKEEDTWYDTESRQPLIELETAMDRKQISSSLNLCILINSYCLSVLTTVRLHYVILQCVS